jgi:hypothetical protein
VSFSYSQWKIALKQCQPTVGQTLVKEVSLKSLRKRNVPKSPNYGHDQGRYIEVFHVRKDEHVVVPPFFKLVAVSLNFRQLRSVVVDWHVVRLIPSGGEDQVPGDTAGVHELLRTMHTMDNINAAGILGKKDVLMRCGSAQPQISELPYPAAPTMSLPHP